ncbi:MAG: D-glucuronyl C5-epimerase family protein [candidate division Zixibacteria bacterium]|nr:D-glucuronyl C5-epimerase family protein [candidate division Zixibacteria bacterium]MDH3936884.1 D-glucuronyl C5-epimerase family protein [candidate division Zixibacteria bacterium]MDH4034919.1 D-glucuronyl C5-epimerase family protein [candidate division Zixibacteria bacterium]
MDTARARRFIEPMDADSIELFHYRGADYYHPVNLSQTCHVLLATFVRTGEDIYLARAERYMQKLMSLCHEADGASWAPYEMLYAVHSYSANRLDPPWYSGMAQCEIRTVQSRLYELTGNTEYLDSARKLFRALLVLQGTGDRWVARIDTTGYYWIEEYPLDDRPAQTLNGFVTALFGVYEYYLASHDPQALEVWELALTTLKAYLPDFHRNGQSSLYCLGHRHEANPGYHKLHISQMRDLHRLTGDSFFLMMAEVFESFQP